MTVSRYDAIKCNHLFIIMFISASLGTMLLYDIIKKDSINSYYDYTYLNTNSHRNLDIKTKPTILITMAIGCKYSIYKTIDSVQYKRDEMSIFWYFNVYNIEKCEYKSYDSLNMTGNRNILIINDNISKMNFWIKHLNPNHIENQFNQKFDYIWCIDEDFLLKYFNFYAFFQISYFINSSISTPSILSRCKTCQGSSYSELNQYSNTWSNDTMNKFGIIAKTVHMIEMMAPLFKFNAFTIIHPYIVKQFVELNPDLNTNWGPDVWWCGAIKLLSDNNGSVPCIIVYYTPIIHLSYKTTKKTKQYILDGFEMLARLKRVYHPFYDPKLFKNHQEFYIDNISVSI